ncbi:unnamed protein product, partial [Laminaria digitata]
RFSRVVWAKRRQRWAMGGSGANVCAVKIVDKQAFWSRVRIGKERVDTLAREVFCQTVLTLKGKSSQSKYEPESHSDFGSEIGCERGSEFGSEFGGSESGSDPNSASDTEGIFDIEDSSWERSARTYTSH